MDLEGFDVVKLVSGRQTLTISHAGISFSQAAIVRLGKPEYVKVMLNKQKKQLAIQITNVDDPGKTLFLRRGKKHSAVRWNNGLLKSSLSDLMNWNLKDYTYKVDGQYITTDKLLLFDLKDATKNKV